MALDDAAALLTPRNDAAIASPNWYVDGYGLFQFSTEADVQAAIKLARAVAAAERRNIWRAINDLIG